MLTLQIETEQHTHGNLQFKRRAHKQTSQAKHFSWGLFYTLGWNFFHIVESTHASLGTWNQHEIWNINHVVLNQFMNKPTT